MTQLEHRDTELAEDPLLDTKLDKNWVFSEAASHRQPVSCPHVSQSTTTVDRLAERVTLSTTEDPHMSQSTTEDPHMSQSTTEIGLAELESLFSLTVLSEDSTYVLSSDKPFVVVLGKWTGWHKEINWSKINLHHPMKPQVPTIKDEELNNFKYYEGFFLKLSTLIKTHITTFAFGKHPAVSEECGKYKPLWFNNFLSIKS